MQIDIDTQPPAPSAFFLDLKVEELYGWEMNKNPLLVESIMRGIKAGDDFPAVKVYHSEKEKKWYLAHAKDGGHHRALAHYLMGKPIKCVSMHSIPERFALTRPIPIKEISFSQDPADEFVYHCTKLMYPEYR